MSKMVELPDPPGDIITSLKLSPVYPNHLLATSIDGQIKLYDIRANTSLQVLNSTHGGILDSCFLVDSNRSFIGNSDGIISELDFINETCNKKIGKPHTNGIKSLISIDQNSLISGSWDKTFQKIDLRSPQVSEIYDLPGKVFAMDSSQDKNKIVIAMSKRLIHIYDPRFIDKPLQVRESGLRYQTRSIKCMPDNQGFVIASIEGKVAVEYFDLSNEVQSKKYAFKCHRSKDQTNTNIEQEIVSSVNSLCFGKENELFTGGSDCNVYLWNYHTKKRSRAFAFDKSVVYMNFNEKYNSLIIGCSDDSYKAIPYTSAGSKHSDSKIYIQSF
ncbi:hypothetical protein PACTADRAFT_1451 [Pachysolen tannophilus NRRL Y-2460]|uniref:Anaphase-promoting complex subunit 4 WD40 domain-containing protein n=1 Tax=Pachysolen tannophilus NRRL Y-2460 TaxID=669874 RepID=A0A1E4TYQ3_PACTA|nr:hypothetical protein PACTADRAFT_1451 [Pachysolen tannophilus NRRL Y-2460]